VAIVAAPRSHVFGAAEIAGNLIMIVCGSKIDFVARGIFFLRGFLQGAAFCLLMHSAVGEAARFFLADFSRAVIISLACYSRGALKLAWEITVWLAGRMAGVSEKIKKSGSRFL
jgi:hypothetical protein